MQLGMSIFAGVSPEEMVKGFLRNGILHTFVMSDHPDFDTFMTLFRENGITCDNLHAPFKGINAMWGEDEAAAETMLAKLKDSVDKCAKYGIPATVLHVSSGRPMPEITERGLARYRQIVNYAVSKNVMPVLENLRFAENLAVLMEKFPECGFCWDNGHQACCTPDVQYLKLYGHRLAALHIQDNRAELDTDDHLLPFDGNIDFTQVAADLAASGYRGTLMLEVGKVAHAGDVYPYRDMTEAEYMDLAASSVKKLNEMIENSRKG